MTRLEWINEILLLWKPGNIVQFMPEHVGKWGDCNAPGADFDPMSGFTPDLAHGKFRIKPRTVKYIVEIPEDSESFYFSNLVLYMENKRRECSYEDQNFIDPIRNAKKLDEN